MNASDLTFGIEIECNLPTAAVNANNIVPGGYHNGRQVPGLPEGWTAQSDSSVRAGRGRYALEIVSPVLKGADGLLQVREVVKTLSRWGAKVNPSCGFHVHVGWQQPTAELKRLVHLVASLEGGVYAATGTRNREQGGYCRPIRDTFRNLSFGGEQTPQIGRYHLLNLTNVLYNGKPTVEFRAFAGTMNFSKIAAYIRLCLGLVERSVNSKAIVKYDPRPVNRERKLYAGKGDGQVEMIRLLYGLGWFKGDQKQQFGAVTATGLPSIDASANTLMTLAVKYDGPRA